MEDKQWEALLQDVSENFNDVTIKRGFQYYKQGRVQELYRTDSDSLEALVEGRDSYRVTLDLNNLSASSCTCPVGNSCKHMMAVLMSYAGMQERPVAALVNAKSAATFRQVVKPSPLAGTARVTHLQDRNDDSMLLLMKQASQLPELPISEWHNIFYRCIIPLGVMIPNSQYARQALERIAAVKPKLSPVMEKLFDLHARLFVLTQLVKPAAPQSSISNHYIGYHTQIAADDLQEALAELLEAELPLHNEPAHWPHIKQTLDYLRIHMLRESSNLHYYSFVYYQLWLNWIEPNLDNRSMIQEELSLLQAAEDELGAELSRLPWMLAQIWMLLQLKEDQTAWDLLHLADRSHHVQLHHILPYLHLLYKNEEWSRLKDWLVEAGPLLRSDRSQTMKHYLTYWEAAVERLPESEPLMWDTLVGMLPISGKIYEEALLEHQKWEQWMDYQLSIGTDPLEFRVTVFQPIEKNAPELMLPFYHQAVDRYVTQKNRDSYKAAVKLLKRLAKLYKKLNQEERWEGYLMTFVNRHSRLRALQEELRKGKLTS